MSQFISELPENIKMIALQRQQDCMSKKIEISKNTDKLVYAFDWKNTIEKWYIWRDVFYSNYKSFYNFHKIK